jgi:hypothetical protein
LVFELAHSFMQVLYCLSHISNPFLLYIGNEGWVSQIIFLGWPLIGTFFFFYSFIRMCIRCLGHLFCPPTPKRRHKHNKKNIAYLLAELRVAIQRDS